MEVDKLFSDTPEFETNRLYLRCMINNSDYL